MHEHVPQARLRDRQRVTRTRCGSGVRRCQCSRAGVRAIGREHAEPGQRRRRVVLFAHDGNGPPVGRTPRNRRWRLEVLRRQRREIVIDALRIPEHVTRKIARAVRGNHAEHIGRRRAGDRADARRDLAALRSRHRRELLVERRGVARERGAIDLRIDQVDRSAGDPLRPILQEVVVAARPDRGRIREAHGRAPRLHGGVEVGVERIQSIRAPPLPRGGVDVRRRRIACRSLIGGRSGRVIAEARRRIAAAIELDRVDVVAIDDLDGHVDEELAHRRMLMARPGEEPAAAVGDLRVADVVATDPCRIRGEHGTDSRRPCKPAAPSEHEAVFHPRLDLHAALVRFEDHLRERVAADVVRILSLSAGGKQHIARVDRESAAPNVHADRVDVGGQHLVERGDDLGPVRETVTGDPHPAHLGLGARSREEHAAGEQRREHPLKVSLHGRDG